MSNILRTVIVLMALTVTLPAPARADTSSEVRDLYVQFLEAQNARDLQGVRAVLLPSADFQWVSDGKSYWGPDALVARMSTFQKAEIWHVTPDTERSRVIEVASDVAYLYQPLVLQIGRAEQPSEIPFLVNVMCVRTDDGWRIAALFTTTEKP